MIKPIETHYKGYRFRSRLEARWAVFFDALGVEWEYEKEGYDLGEAGWYLPDFWLPLHKTWVEIKGVPEEHDYDVIVAMEKEDHQAVMVGNIPSPGDNIHYFPGSILARQTGIPLPDEQKCISNLFGWNNDKWHHCEDDWGYQLGCPVCGYGYVDFEKPDYRSSNDTWGIAWSGRGDALSIPMSCERGHSWVLRFGFHKGGTWFAIENATEWRDCFGLWLTGGDIELRDKALRAARSARFEHGETDDRHHTH